MTLEPLVAAREVADSNRRRALLSSHPVLSCLSAEELDHVLGFVVARRYGAGEAMFRKGDAGESMMLIAAGTVKVSALGPDGREAVLAVLGEGEILGEMAILDNKPRSADATALEPCEMLVLRQRDFLPFLERNPAVAVRLLAMISERLRRTSELLEDRMLRSLPGRLAKALLDLGKCGEAPCPPGTRIPLVVRQWVFASLLGTTRESLNKLLHAWKKEGLIGLERGSVVLERPDDLCLPDFSGPAFFARILDRARAGRFVAGPDRPVASERGYVGDSNVLLTTFRIGDGELRLTDAMTIPPALEPQLLPQRELLRCIEAVGAEVPVEIIYEPRPDYGRSDVGLARRGKLGWACAYRDHLLLLYTDVPLELSEDGRCLRGRFTLACGSSNRAISFGSTITTSFPLLSTCAGSA